MILTSKSKEFEQHKDVFNPILDSENPAKLLSKTGWVLVRNVGSCLVYKNTKYSGFYVTVAEKNKNLRACIHRL